MLRDGRLNILCYLNYFHCFWKKTDWFNLIHEKGLFVYHSLNDKHGKHCNYQQKLYSSFFISSDIMIGRESLVVLAQVMSAKRDEPLSHEWEWVNGRIKIAVARSYSHMIYKARLRIPLWERDPDWDPKSGIGLAC